MVTVKLFRCVLPFGGCFCKNIIGECFIRYCMTTTRLSSSVKPTRGITETQRVEQSLWQEFNAFHQYIIVISRNIHLTLSWGYILVLTFFFTKVLHVINHLDTKAKAKDWEEEVIDHWTKRKYGVANLLWNWFPIWEFPQQRECVSDMITICHFLNPYVFVIVVVVIFIVVIIVIIFIIIIIVIFVVFTITIIYFIQLLS